MWDKMFRSVDLLQHGMSAAWTRNAVIRNNLANVETPGFKASDVEFESLLAAATAEHVGGFVCTKTHGKHLDIGSGVRPRTDVMSIQPLIFQREDTMMRMDENNVDIESENVKLAQNTIFYNTLMEKMNGEIRRLRLAISDTK